jgi:hypothetical protein
MPLQALADLHEGVLGMSGLAAVGEIFIELRIGQLAAEPGLIPEKERKQNHQESEKRDKKVCFPAGAAVGRHVSIDP